MNNIWLFGATKFQGNPKFLFTYINKYKKEISAFWIADTQEQVDYICALGYSAFLMNTEIANDLFSVADVYVIENFREVLPISINKQIKIANLWHGVGLKHVELALGETSSMVDSVVRKYVKNMQFYKNNCVLLTTSEFMENHFIEDMKLSNEQIIKGVYPRNIIAFDENFSTYDKKNIQGINLDNYKEVILYAPTYREGVAKLSIQALFPQMDKLHDLLIKKNAIFIFKLHHFDESNNNFIDFKNTYSSYKNFIFWENEKDIYEIFDKIDVAIIDYSSIFYDLLQSGVKKAIRYIPDFDLYNQTRGIKFDYLKYTGGMIANDFNQLINIIENNTYMIENREFLLDKFFNYSDDSNAYNQIENVINQIENFKPKLKKLKKLYSFDVFDTLICRKYVDPVCVFVAVQQEMKRSKYKFSNYFINNYPQLRKEIESDVRDVFKKTTFERKSKNIEIDFDSIFIRMAENFNLTNNQIDFLKSTEMKFELDFVEPIPSKINELLRYSEEGNDVVLISDMYLPKYFIKKMIDKADKRLNNFKLYLSSDIGKQKSTGLLYKHIFFDLDYQYSLWTHFGDNLHADNKAAKKLGINSIHHAMNKFLKFEKDLINIDNSLDCYKISSLINKKRWSLLDSHNMDFNEIEFYGYQFAGSFFVPYVLWSIKDAMKKGYKKLYFISRDGYFLKAIADNIIKKRNYNIKTEYIYGSRKAWRLASQIEKIDDEFFGEFGLFSSMNNFDDVVNASQLSVSELEQIVPEIFSFKHLESFRGDIAVEIREVFKKNDLYKQKLLEIGAQQREIVVKYLNQSINYKEKFAFVEFWGRGYTQDLLAKLLKFSSGREISTDFYYVRCFNSSSGTSVRHRFIQSPINFSFVEPIFACTPYKTISGYMDNGSSIEPIINIVDNEYHEIFMNNLLEFSNDYLNQEFYDEDNIGRLFSIFSYKYHLKNINDQYILNVYSELKDNINSYGEPIKYASELLVKDFHNIDIGGLKNITSNLEISLIKSTEEVRKLYLEKCNFQNLKPINIRKRMDLFPYNELSRYINIAEFPVNILIKKDLPVYSSIQFSDENLKDIKLVSGEVISVTNILWNHAGIPRLQFEKGIISAHVDLVEIYIQDQIELIKSIDFEYLKNKILIQSLSCNGLTDLSDEKILTDQMNIFDDKKGSIHELNDNELHDPVALKIYKDLDFKIPTGKILDANNQVKPLSIKLSKDDTPGIEIKDGSITLNREFVELREPAQISEIEIPVQKVRKDIERYISELNGKKIRTRVSLNIYQDIGLTVKTGQKIASDTCIDPLSIQWTQGGTPRIEIAEGFITSNREFVELREPAQISGIEIPVQKVRKDIERYISELNGKKIRTRVSLNIYQDIGLTVKTGQKIASDTCIDPLSIQWTQGGTPRIEIAEGFITSNREFVEFSKLECISEINISVPVQDSKSSNELVILKMISNLLNSLKNKM